MIYVLISKILSTEKRMNFKDQLLSSLADEYENNGGTYNLKKYAHEKDEKTPVYIDVSQYPQHLNKHMEQYMQQYKQQLIQEMSKTNNNKIDETRINELIRQQLSGIHEQINTQNKIISEHEARMQRLSKYEPLLRNLSEVELLKIDTINEYAQQKVSDTSGINGVQRGEFRDGAHEYAKGQGVPVTKPEITRYMIDIFGWKSHPINGYETYEGKSWNHRMNKQSNILPVISTPSMSPINSPIMSGATSPAPIMSGGR
jgi:hypothetical protein